MSCLEEKMAEVKEHRPEAEEYLHTPTAEASSMTRTEREVKVQTASGPTLVELLAMMALQLVKEARAMGLLKVTTIWLPVKREKTVYYGTVQSD